jgi:transcription-repair coupling factor (superfamily II helicase)
LTRLQSHLIELAARDKSVARWADHVQPPAGKARKRAPRPLEIAGLGGSAPALALAGLAERTKRPLVIVAPSNEAADQLHDDFSHLGWPRLAVLPAWEILPYEDEEPLLEITAKRLDALGLWLQDNERAPTPSIVVVASDALMQRVPPPERLAPRRVVIRWGEPLDLHQLSEDLVAAGYERRALVEGRGEFSIRGNIIDVFPPTAPLPIRLDLFGDEIEAIRFFDTATQRSRKDKPEAEEIVLEPARERAMMAEGDLVPLTDWLPSGALVHLQGADLMGDHAQRFRELILRRFDEARSHAIREERELPQPIDALFVPLWEDVIGALSEHPISYQATIPPRALESKDEIEFHVSSFESIKPDLQTYIDSIRSRQREGSLVIVACDNDGQVMRLDELLHEAQLDTTALFTDKTDTWKPPREIGGVQPVVLMVGPLHHGFTWRALDLIVITDREIFGRYRRRHHQRKFRGGSRVAAVDEIRRGDHVVHVDHGIGVFQGIRRQQVDGDWRDLIELVYAEGNKLLVPVEKIRHVQRYSVTESEKPQLDKLGSRKWLQRRKRSQKRIREMAEQLLKLYAQRASAEGRACIADTAMQTEFEASFLYPETPDQLKAIEEVRADLERARPMDRLICGDVGFGKTEVAIRAAFKVVEDGRQVAFLCPTTILAQQHHQTLTERFAEYPVRIDVMSRFRSAAEQRETIARLKRGEVDVVVGTHRLLSKDVEFLDLGLVIVDEEQRFGVAHKERLKELRASVDVLTLTATPIPRTLHMALSGLRDMSLIQTPPADRQPIRTRTIHWDEELLGEALLRELNRGGQIYFVHNRVHNIQSVAKRLQEIVPNAKIAIAHGQMSEHALEDVFVDFVEGKYDILVATTIIENGLDIPNVNTIIVNRADAFGLAQLYQLRGRVGRDVKRAYAYMIVPEGEVITEEAVRRLSTLEEFSDLGVGFQIALRDLEIRGTGNLLGGEQHGAMLAIGYDLYCELLEEEIKNLKGEPVAPWRDLEVKWPMSALIPETYVPLESQRLTFYKRLSATRTAANVDAFSEELIDRFGHLPPEAIRLLQVARLRVIGGEIGLTQIAASGDVLRLSGASWTHQITRDSRPAGVKAIKVDSATVARILIPELSLESRLSALVNLLTMWAERARSDAERQEVAV